MRLRTSWLVPVLLALLPGCPGSPGHEHGQEGHAHAEESLPAEAVTVWTQATELFAEYEPLIVGRENRFAGHLTALASFKPLSEGVVTLTLVPKSGRPVTARVEGPSSPGIFRPTLKPMAAGPCELRIAVESSALRDEFVVGPCQVFSTEAEARAAQKPEEDQGGIAFLKEQQWKTDFSTVTVSERELQPSVHAHGEVTPVAGREARLAAPSAGRVFPVEPTPVMGMRVDAGQLLATISPRLSGGVDKATLEAELIAAKAELENASAQRDRAEKLRAEGAIPERSLEEARARVNVARARVEAATSRLAQFEPTRAGSLKGGLQIRSPLAGTLVFADATNGALVEEGKLLYSVIDLDKVWLTARIFEPDIPKVEKPSGAWFTIEGYDEAFVIDEKTGRLVTVGRVIDAASRTVPIVFEVQNPEHRLRIGQFAQVFVATGAAKKALAIPEAAILDDGAKPVAFVQVEGERFERRALVLGTKSRGLVEVREGLAAGEHVVVKGAYEVKLAGASGAIPQHGHVH